MSDICADVGKKNCPTDPLIADESVWSVEQELNLT